MIVISLKDRCVRIPSLALMEHDERMFKVTQIEQTLGLHTDGSQSLSRGESLCK